MPGRNHHFVPQFYLRAFSLDRRSVNCFNFAEERAIAGASIKTQCSRRDFHAFAPGLEESFGELEGHAATILRTIRSLEEPPPMDTAERAWLLAFVIYQKMRTTRSAATHATMKDYFVQDMLKRKPGKPLAELGIRDEPPVALPIELAGQIVPIAADLGMHLFRNETSREFVTSDDPVVAHNQYCEGIANTGVLGWGCTGFQAFLPLSPNSLLMLFDRTVYKVGLSHKGQHTTSIVDESEVEQLNALQILNAEKNIYFANWAHDNRTAEECHRLARKRNPARTIFVETEARPTGENRFSTMIGHFEPMLPHQLKIGSITIRKQSRRVSLMDRSRMHRKLLEQSHPVPASVRFPADIPQNYKVKKITRR